MNISVQLENRPGQSLAVVRRIARRTDLARVVRDGCGVVWNGLQKCGAQGAGRHIAVYWDDLITVEVGVEIGPDFQSIGEVQRSDTPAGLVAFACHRGPYHTLFQAYDAIRQFCTDRGFRVTGPSWELYGHWQESWNHDPSRIETEVCVRIEPV